jgi:hypothetical protein
MRITNKYFCRKTYPILGGNKTGRTSTKFPASIDF